MAEAFDSYYKWLAIPPDEQPPHHYRLLGTKVFEADPDVIEASADQRMRHVRSFQSGQRAADSQRLLNEIATARVCLLDTQKKAAYDAKLRLKLQKADAKSPAVTPDADQHPKWPSGQKPRSFEDFQKCLVASGLMSADEIATYVRKLPPNAREKKELIKTLIRGGELTKYQAQAVYEGNIAHLVLGDYLVLDEIGAGGMGVVLRAQHRRMKRTVALKMLPAHAMQDETAVQRFYREVEAAAKLIHTNIVTAFDAGEHQGVHFLVMEFVDGKDLATVLQEHGPLPVEQAVECAIQTARGLEFAHSKGVVHRDIKPGNLLLAKDGTVKILDMGLARLAESVGDVKDTGPHRLTHSGQMMGTADYMSPEQAEDTRDADHRSDIYSLGCTLYRLLSGKTPYEGDTIMKTLLAHRDAPIPSLCERRADVPPELNNVFQKMVAKDIAERYQSMSEVVTALTKCLNPQAAPPRRRQDEPSSDSALTAFMQKLEHGGVATKKPIVAGGAEDTIQPRAEVDTSEQLPAPVPPAQPPIAPPAAPAKPLAQPQPPAKPPVASPPVAGPSIAKASITKSSKPKPRTQQDKKKVFLVIGGLSAAVLVLATVSSLTLGSRPSGPDDPGGQPPLDGGPGGGLAFDGKTNYVEIPTLTYDGSHPITLEVIITTDKPFPAHYRNVIGNGGIEDISIWFFNSELRIDAGKTRIAHEAGPRKSGLDRAHIAGVYDGKQLSLFLNGKKLGSKTVQRIPPSDIPFHIGASGPQRRENLRDYFRGTFHELRISNIARYQDDFTPEDLMESDDQTLALYHFGQVTGNVVPDASGNGHDGTIYGKERAPAQLATGSGRTVDLLKRIDLKKNKIYGNAKFEGSALLFGGGSRSLYHIYGIPYPPPAQYDLELVIEPIFKEGTTPFCLGLSIEGRGIPAMIDGGSRETGFTTKFAAAPDEFRGQLLSKGKRTTIKCAVRKNQVYMTADGRPVLDCKGPFKHRKKWGSWIYHNKHGMHGFMLGTHSATYRIYSLTMTPNDSPIKTSKTTEAFSQPTGQDGWIDLLSHVIPAEDTAFGEFALRDGELQSVNGDERGRAACAFPVIPQGSYELEYEFTPTGGAGKVHFYLPAGDQAGIWGSAVNAKTYFDVFFLVPPTGRPTIAEEPKNFAIKQRAKLHVTARFERAEMSLQVDLDGIRVAEWRGEPNRFHSGKLALPDPLAPGFHVNGTSIMVHSAKLRMLDGTAELRRPALTGVVSGQVTATDGPVDLLPLIDLQQDTLGGRWKQNEKGLTSEGDGPHAKLALPVVVEGDYELQSTFFREAGDDAVAFLLPVGDTRVALILDGWTGHKSALQLVKGLQGHIPDNPTMTQAFEIQTSRQNDVTIRVTTSSDQAAITVIANNEKIIDWTGPQSDLKSDDRLPDPRMIGVGIAGSKVRFASIRLKMLSGKALFVRSNDE